MQERPVLKKLRFYSSPKGQISPLETCMTKRRNKPLRRPIIQKLQKFCTRRRRARSNYPSRVAVSKGSGDDQARPTSRSSNLAAGDTTVGSRPNPAGERCRVSQPDRSPRHDDRTRPAGLSHVRGAGGVRAQPDPGAHPSGPRRRAACWPHRRPAAETHRRRHRGRQGDAGEPRHRRDPDRAPPRRVPGDALSVHPGRANREYARRLTTAALSQRGDAPGGFQPGGGRRQCADSGRWRHRYQTAAPRDFSYTGAATSMVKGDRVTTVCSSSNPASAKSVVNSAKVRSRPPVITSIVISTSMSWGRFGSVIRSMTISRPEAPIAERQARKIVLTFASSWSNSTRDNT